MLKTGLQTLGATAGIYQGRRDNKPQTVAKRALVTVGGAAACILLNSRGPLKNRAHWLFFGSMALNITPPIRQGLFANVFYGAILAGAFLLRNAPFATKPIPMGLVMAASQVNFAQYSPHSVQKKFSEFKAPILGLETLGFGALVYKAYAASK